jgi:hypothetical protein
MPDIEARFQRISAESHRQTGGLLNTVQQEANEAQATTISSFYRLKLQVS